jgi:hypothetical protein
MEDDRHPSVRSLVVPIVATQRDIGFSLRLDSLAARIEAAEALVCELRAEQDALQAERDALVAQQAAMVDADGEPHENGEWLGHDLVRRATELLP